MNKRRQNLIKSANRFAHNVLGSESALKQLLNKVAFYIDSSAGEYVQNLKLFIESVYMLDSNINNLLDDTHEENNWLNQLDNEVRNLNEREFEEKTIRETNIPWHKFHLNSLRAYYILIREGITQFQSPVFYDNRGYNGYIFEHRKNNHRWFC